MSGSSFDSLVNIIDSSKQANVETLNFLCKKSEVGLNKRAPGVVIKDKKVTEIVI